MPDDLDTLHIQELKPAEERWLNLVLDVVRERRGVDFRGYRLPTLYRRVRNRMIAARIGSQDEYLEWLRREPDEPGELLKRLTIKVSRFFRNPAVFEALRPILAQHGDVPPAVWSAGCGQGEEAYSIAMLLRQAGFPSDATVLGTDVDPDAIAFAKQGVYPEAALESIEPGLRRKYFTATVAGRKPAGIALESLRAQVDFDVHDLTSGMPPRARLFDLILCRNVLIYFQPQLQERVFHMLLRALKPGGTLCLGESEWLAHPFAAHLNVVDRRLRLFQLRTPVTEEVSI